MMAIVVPRLMPALSASIRPPLALTNALAIHSPRPEPDMVEAWRGPRKKRSPSWAFSSSVRPAPVSRTDRTRPWPLRFAATVMVEPEGEYLAALSTICAKACSISTGST